MVGCFTIPYSHIGEMNLVAETLVKKARYSAGAEVKRWEHHRGPDVSDE